MSIDEQVVRGLSPEQEEGGMYNCYAHSGRFPGLLFAFPAPKAYIEAQVELRGWNREGDVQAEILGGKVGDWDPTAGSS